MLYRKDKPVGPRREFNADGSEKKDSLWLRFWRWRVSRRKQNLEDPNVVGGVRG